MLNDIYHSLNPVAFSLGPLDIRWYGLAYLLAFLVGGFLMWSRIRHWKIRIPAEDLLIVVSITGIGIVVGARLGYCLFYGNGTYFVHPLEILAFSEGGMSFHGGVIGALIAGFLATKAMRLSFITMADLVAIVAPVGLFFGRIANFINGELWGKVTNVPWGVVFETGGVLPRHPSQLYEALLEGLVLFIILFALSHKVPARPKGTFIGTFLLLYGVFRILVEFVRVPDVQLGYLWGFITMGQLLSIPLVIAGIVILVIAYKKKAPQTGKEVWPQGGEEEVSASHTT